MPETPALPGDREPDQEPGLRVEVAAFAQGGVVQQTGLALVHKDERIEVPPYARAVIQPVEVAAGGEIHYHFPIEIVVVGEIPESEKQALEERIWTALHRALA